MQELSGQVSRRPLFCTHGSDVTSQVLSEEKMAGVCSSRDWGGKAGIFLGLGVFLSKGNTGEC